MEGSYTSMSKEERREAWGDRRNEMTAQDNKPVPTNPGVPARQTQLRSPVFDMVAATSETVSLGAYWEILRKRRATILAATVITTGLVALVVFRMRPIYQATARMEVQAETPQLQTLNNLNQPSATDDAFLQTQVDLLQNNNLAWETAEQLKLATLPEFQRPTTISSLQPTPASTEAQAAVIRALKGRLKVNLLPNSRLIEVSFESTDPKLAASIANTLVSNYVELSFRSKYDATRHATSWMEQQLDELKEKVEKSQQDLVDYERVNSIAEVGDKQNIVQERLSDLSKDLTGAETDRANKESIYDSIQSNIADAALVTNDPLLQQLDSKYAELKTEYAASTSQYGPGFYKVKELSNQLSEVESLMDRERKHVAERIGSDYRTALRREKLLSQEVTRQKAEVEKLNQLLIQYNLLKGEFETNQELYRDLLKRLKDATISESLRATTVRLADEALVPTAPIRPNRKADVATGLIVGLILGVTLAFIQNSLDRSIKTAQDLERIVALPTLAMIPQAAKSRRRYGRLFPRGPSNGTGDATVATMVLNQPSSEIAESFRILRTSILLSTAPRPPQMLLVTSSNPREGKTSTSVNLALALAQRGSRVLLVDADLRNPGVSRVLGLNGNGAKGLSSYLTGAHDFDSAIHPHETLPNMWVLPSGPIPPNPAELLSSPTMEGLVRDLRGRFDHIVIDSPPLLLVTDATLLSAWVDGVVLVVESGVASRGGVKWARRILDQAGARVLGVALNKLDQKVDGFYGSRYRYYGYYYHRGFMTSELPGKPASQDHPPSVAN
jgi:capsular exopolysaccharide synthesis family protein